MGPNRADRDGGRRDGFRVATCTPGSSTPCPASPSPPTSTLGRGPPSTWVDPPWSMSICRTAPGSIWFANCVAMHRSQRGDRARHHPGGGGGRRVRVSGETVRPHRPGRPTGRLRPLPQDPVRPKPRGADVDAAFDALRPKIAAAQSSAPTAASPTKQLVMEALHASDSPMSAAEVATATGASWRRRSAIWLGPGHQRRGQGRPALWNDGPARAGVHRRSSSRTHGTRRLSGSSPRVRRRSRPTTAVRGHR